MSENKLGSGGGKALLERAQERFPHNPLRQATFFLERVTLQAATGRSRPVSEKTRSDFGAALLRAVQELKQEGMPVRNLSEIRRKHVVALVRRWLRDGQEPATLQTKLSHMRRFLAIVGKPAVLPKRAELLQMLAGEGMGDAQLWRTKVLQKSKTWESAGLDAIKLIESIRGEDDLVAIQMELQLAFGLRVLESLEIEPSQSDEGNKLLVYRGAKGGRGRTVDFDSNPMVAAWQRDVLERAKVLAKQHPKRRLARKGFTLAQSRRRYYYVAGKFGLNKQELGVTSHGLRHQFAARLYESVAGVPPPVEGAIPLTDISLHAKAMREGNLAVSEQLGHWREDISTAYLGSTASMTREARTRLKNSIALFEGDAAIESAFASVGVQQAWLIGRAALGLVLGPQEAIQLQVRLDVGQGGLAERIAGLQRRLYSVTGRVVQLSIWLGEDSPGDSVELFLGSAGDSETGNAKRIEIEQQTTQPGLF